MIELIVWKTLIKERSKDLSFSKAKNMRWKRTQINLTRIYFSFLTFHLIDFGKKATTTRTENMK